MATTTRQPKVYGFLPNDRPVFGQMLVLGLQHVITMFPATVLCALLMGFPVSTVLAVTGFGTVIAVTVSKLATGNFIPLYYGSSFSYIAAVVAITQASYGKEAPVDLVRIAQCGFIATAIINIVVGAIIRGAGGKKAIDRVLPPVVTGSVACTIGIGLGASALNMASGVAGGIVAGDLNWWAVALITLVATIAFSVYLQGKGFIGLLPVLLGAILGYLVAIPFGLVNFAGIGQSSLITAPRITFPDFTSPLTITAIFSVGIMAIATIPESTAHLYQISLYVDHLADEMGRPKFRLSEYIGINLMIDGLNDLINGLLGSTAGTNYGENNSLMVITRNYSGPVLITAGVISMVLGFIGPLADVIRSIPTAVSGGLSIYLFGVIGMQGIALMMSERVNLFDPKQLAIGAAILIVGIGGNIGYPGGFLPVPLLQGVFPNGWPAIATGAVLGIILNLIFLVFPAPERAAIELKYD
jgi:uracil permease